MGIKVLSFVIKDIIDHVNYLSSIGRVQTAIVKKDAAIGVAEANRDSEIAVSGKKFIAYFVQLCFYSNPTVVMLSSTQAAALTQILFLTMLINTLQQSCKWGSAGFGPLSSKNFWPISSWMQHLVINFLKCNFFETCLFFKSTENCRKLF